MRVGEDGDLELGDQFGGFRGLDFEERGERGGWCLAPILISEVATVAKSGRSI